MITLEQLKTSIEEKIRTNGNGEITGQVLQDVLKEIGDFADVSNIAIGTGLRFNSANREISTYVVLGNEFTGENTDASPISLRLSSDMKKGYYGNLEINLGSGFIRNYGDGKIMINLGSGFSLDNNTINLRVGDGLRMDDSLDNLGIVMAIGDGLKVVPSGNVTLDILPSKGLILNSGLAVNFGSSLTISNDKLEVAVGSGLKIDTDGRISLA